MPTVALGLREGASLLSALKALRKILGTFQPDIIQGWMYHGNLVASIASGLAPGSPSVYWNVRQTLYDIDHEKTGTRWIIGLCSLISGRPKAIIYNSSVSCQQHEDFGFSKRSHVVIPNGFDLLTWRPDTNGAIETRRSLGIAGSAVVIGHVARFHPMKNHESFVKAAVNLLSENAECEVVLAGLGVTPDNEALNSLVPDSLKPRFHWLGERRDVLQLMQCFDVFCLSSAWGEAFPNVLGEAMATGTPCISTDVGDSRYIVGDTGTVVQANDQDALVGGLQKLVSMSVALRNERGMEARGRIQKLFALEAVINDYSRLYRSSYA